MLFLDLYLYHMGAVDVVRIKKHEVLQQSDCQRSLLS